MKKKRLNIEIQEIHVEAIDTLPIAVGPCGGGGGGGSPNPGIGSMQPGGGNRGGGVGSAFGGTSPQGLSAMGISMSSNGGRTDMGRVVFTSPYEPNPMPPGGGRR